MNPQDPKPGGRPVAQADVLGEDAVATGAMEGLSGDAGARTPPDRGQAARGDEEGEARPGKDENQAGFLKSDSDGPGRG
ncbi:hypothetical protein [Ramlibacter tataouinensis]|uniref:Uncharacterized protein n=1 Tax=Ramlibacter tataouinensis (strain ATCC BAA-407 / DSM 14655 / LMG 21543 / TTB310) TaxID=365046 RepID=F5XYI9_RAMTT|nr:hypothetical protein [Ramlibacter tataouinensis]AEG93165.1 hypothetical protein Rta_20720 [Ramlibacter tataouinensis TTB310]